MTEGWHYRVDFVTFSRILGFSKERGFTYIHDKPRAEIRESKVLTSLDHFVELSLSLPFMSSQSTYYILTIFDFLELKITEA